MGTPQEGEKYYDKWNEVVKEALGCLNTKTLTWQHLPNAGGFYDQDDFLMMIWEYIKYCYYDLMSNKKDRQDIDKARERL